MNLHHMEMYIGLNPVFVNCDTLFERRIVSVHVHMPHDLDKGLQNHMLERSKKE